MADSAGEFDRAPLVMKLLFAGSGIAIMLLATGVIPVDEGAIRAPRWVVFAAGLVFLLVAVLLFIARRRFAHPAEYLFIAATLCSLFTAILCWIAFWSSGPFNGGLLIGPLSVPTPSIAPRILFGIAALLTASLCALAWARWWRALRGRPVDLSR